MPLFENQVVVVTGADRGIGAATARLFAEHGASVVVNDLDAAPAAETADAIRQAGGEAHVVAGSVTEDGATANPLGRPGTDREAAGGAVLMASPLAGYVTGHTLEVTGGAGI